MTLFIELFPLVERPALTAYALHLNPDTPDPDRIGRALARHLTRQLGGEWLWAETQLWTELAQPLSILNEEIALLREALPQTYAVLDSLRMVQAQPTPPRVSAEYAIHSGLAALTPQIKTALKPFDLRLRARPGDVLAEREIVLRAWDVGGDPAIALSIATRLRGTATLQSLAYTLDDPATQLPGMRVIDMDAPAPVVSEIVGVPGTVGQQREALGAQRAGTSLRQRIDAAPDDALCLKVMVGPRQMLLPATLLNPLLRPADFARFNLTETQGNIALRPQPDARAAMVKAASDIAKDAGLIDRAYNASTAPQRFLQPEFDPYVRFGQRRTRPYNPKTLYDDFSQMDAYHLRDLFRQGPIEVCVVNALDLHVADFMEALQRQLKRSFGFEIALLRERRVRVVSLANLEAAVRLVEKEAPDLILAFLPDDSALESDADTGYNESVGSSVERYLTSLTLGRALPTHVITQAMLNDPDAMTGIIMAVLAKTGNTPFALSDKLDFADVVAGLDLIRETFKTQDNDRLTAIARLYAADGQFWRYAVRTHEQAPGVPLYVLMRDLFPQRDFSGQRVLIHHDGPMDEALRQALMLWGQAISAQFAIVQIIRYGAARLYALMGRQVSAPPPGSAFALSDTHAFYVAANDPHQPTPQPHQVVVQGVTLPQALNSLRLWMLLYYGTQKTPQVPVTIYNAGGLAYWVQRGGAFSEPEGEVPFWL